MSEYFQEKVVSLFLELVKIASPSFEEKPVFDFIENHLKGKHAEVRRIPYASSKFDGRCTENMIIKLPATDKSKKSLFFDAHADTVLPCHNVVPVVEDGVIRSDGTTILGADDKCGIASMLCALDIILEKKLPHGDLIFIVSSAEEVGLIGAQYIPQEELSDIDYGFVLDSGGPVGTITTKAPYHYDYRITVTGRAAHAAMNPEKGINAVKLAAEIIMQLPSGRLADDTVANVGVVEGGQARNVVPAEALIIGEFRSLIHEKCFPIRDQILKIADSVKPKAVSIECVINKTNDGYNFDESTPIVEFAARALREIGIEAAYEASCGGTNANIYAGMGIPTTVLSVGMEEIHSIKEYIRISDLVDTVKLILKMVELS